MDKMEYFLLGLFIGVVLSGLISNFIGRHSERNNWCYKVAVSAEDFVDCIDYAESPWKKYGAPKIESP